MLSDAATSGLKKRKEKNLSIGVDQIKAQAGGEGGEGGLIKLFFFVPGFHAASNGKITDTVLN